MNNITQADKITDLKEGMAQAIAEGIMTQVDPPLEHFYAPGLYGRRIFVQAGSIIATKVHKSEHITVALKGHCTVVDGAGNKTEVIAPMVFVTRPGTQRAVYAHDDVEWLTVHACEEKELEDIEKALVCDSFEELDQYDYKKVLTTYNMTEAQAREMSENPRSQMMMPVTEQRTVIQPSARQGMGVFAAENIGVEERIGPVMIQYLRTPIGRYTNHSMHPNCEFRLTDNGLDAYALSPIKKGTEITVCYHQARTAGIEASRLMENKL